MYLKSANYGFNYNYLLIVIVSNITEAKIVIFRKISPPLRTIIIII